MTTRKIPEGWSEDDVVIACYRLKDCDCPAGTVHNPDGPVISLRCDLCCRPIAAAPITAEKQTREAHVICRECFATLPITKWAGRIKRGARELPL